jgi:hypothetical protein
MQLTPGGARAKPQGTRHAASVQQWQPPEPVLVAFAVADLLTSYGPSVMSGRGYKPIAGCFHVQPAYLNACAMQHQQSAHGHVHGHMVVVECASFGSHAIKCSA